MASTSIHSNSTLVKLSPESVEGLQQRRNIIPPYISTTSTLSTGIPITFGTVKCHRVSIPNNAEKVGCVTAVLDEDSEYASRIRYVFDIHSYPKMSSRLVSDDFTLLDYSDVFDDTQDEAVVQCCCVTRNQLIAQNALSGSIEGDDFDLYKHGKVNMVVDKTIALRYAEQETTAVKNRIILIGLTLTIPLFLYIRFTIWHY